MLINTKLRGLLKRLHWPLVTRSRFLLNKENYEAELKQVEKEAGALRNLLTQEKAAHRATEERYNRELAAKIDEAGTLRTVIKDRNILIEELQTRLKSTGLGVE